MEFEELTEEQKAKAQACKTPEELLQLAQEEGVDLSDEDMAKIAGGNGIIDGYSPGCPRVD